MYYMYLGLFYFMNYTWFILMLPFLALYYIGEAAWSFFDTVGWKYIHPVWKKSQEAKRKANESN